MSEPKEPNGDIEARLFKLIKGDEPPPNRFSKYIVDKLRASRQDFDACVAEIKQLEEHLRGLKQRVLVLEGEHNKYLADLRVWCEDKGEEGEAPVAPKKEEALGAALVATG